MRARHLCTIKGYERRRAVELTIKREVHDIRNFVIKVEELGAGKVAVTVWRG